MKTKKLREYTVSGRRGTEKVKAATARRAVRAWAGRVGLGVSDPPETVEVTRGSYAASFEVWASDQPRFIVGAA